MTCYTIFTLYPLQDNPRINLMNQRALQNLVRVHRANLITSGEMNGYVVSEVVLCDEDAAAFLRDLPEPYLIAAIVIRSQKVLFYTNPLMRTDKRPVPPRRGTVEKDIYWWAAKSEKRIPRGSSKISI